MILLFALCFGTLLFLMLCHTSRPEPPPVSVEEEILRVAFNKINWRYRPRINNLSIVPHGGFVISLRDDMRKIHFDFFEGKVRVHSNNKNYVDVVDLARPDSIKLLSDKIEKHYTNLLK